MTWFNTHINWIKTNKIKSFVMGGAVAIATLWGGFTALGSFCTFVDASVLSPYVNSKVDKELKTKVEPRIKALADSISVTRSQVVMIYFNQLASMTPEQIAKAQAMVKEDSMGNALRGH